jgi:hypothetical protein
MSGGRRFVKDNTDRGRVSAKDIRREAKQARAHLRALKSAEAPSRMEFEMAVQAAVMKQKAKSAGYVDLALAGYNVNTTGSIVLAATVAQGVSVNQRVGKKAVWKSMQLRGFVQADTTTAIADWCVVLVYDREPTGALPLITDIFVSITSASMLNDANSSRFQIVRRWDGTLIGNVTTPSTGREAQNFDEYVDLKKRPVQFAAAGTGAIGDITKGALYLVTMGNVAAGTADGTAFLGLRTRFIDVEG